MPDDNLQLPGTTSPGSSKGSFRIRRAKTELTGWVWRRELTYELQLSWAGPEPGASTTSPLEDFVLNWDASKDRRFQVAVGQFKVPLGRQEMTSSSRQQFADRDILSNEFTRGRDVGVQLWGLLAKGKVEYRAGIFNGNPAARSRTTTTSTSSTRASCSSPSETCGIRRATSSRRTSRSSPWPASGRTTTWPAPPTPMTSTRGSSAWTPSSSTGGSPSSPSTSRDTARRRRGLASTPTASTRRSAISCCATGSRWRARWAGYDPTDLIPDNDRTEVGGVVNYYFNRHNLKLQGDFRQLDDDSRGISAKEIRVQTQVVF